MAFFALGLHLPFDEQALEEQALAGAAAEFDGGGHMARVVPSAEGRNVGGTPIYKQMTIRNWNTTSKLAAMMGKKG